MVSVNYTGDEKPGRVKAASILPFWYLPEYSCRVFFLFPDLLKHVMMRAFFFVEVQTSHIMRASCSDVMLPELHSCSLGKEKDCLALAEYREHLQVVGVSPSLLSASEDVSKQSFYGECNRPMLKRDSCYLVSAGSDERKSGSRIRDFV